MSSHLGIVGNCKFEYIKKRQKKYFGLTLQEYAAGQSTRGASFDI